MRVTVVALMDVLMILTVKYYKDSNPGLLWATLIISTALQTAASSLQFNAQMTFFASRVDRNIGGSYMTLLNTFANLGGTWPASPVLYMMGRFTNPGDVLNTARTKPRGSEATSWYRSHSSL